MHPNAEVLEVATFDGIEFKKRRNGPSGFTWDGGPKGGIIYMDQSMWRDPYRVDGSWFFSALEAAAAKAIECQRERHAAAQSFVAAFERGTWF